MKNKKLTIGIITLAVAVVGASFAASALAYQGDPNTQGPNHSPERHEAMTKAFEGSDYNAWKELMSDKGRVTEVVNEGNFSRFAEAHRLAVSGDLDGAKEIRAELGLGQGSQNRGSRGDGSHRGNKGTNHGTRGQNVNGNFVDANGDGACDNLQ